MSRVSIAAELTFDRLITYVDDYGRGDAHPDILKAGLFPLRAEVDSKMVWGWLCELIAEGCVRHYIVDERDYLVLTGWEKHRGNSRRAKTSKFPEPPESVEEKKSTRNLPDPPDIRESPGDPPGGKESGVRSRESRVEGMEARLGTHPAASPPPSEGWATSAVLKPNGGDLTPQPEEIAHAAQKLVNLLGREKGGDKAAKLLFLEENLVLMMLDVQATPGLAPDNRNALLKKKVISWWRWRQKNPTGMLLRPTLESFDERQRRENLEWFNSLSQ